MEEGETLAEDLGFVVSFDAQSLLRVQASEAPLEFDQNIVVHRSNFPETAVRRSLAPRQVTAPGSDARSVRLPGSMEPESRETMSVPSSNRSRSCTGSRSVAPTNRATGRRSSLWRFASRPWQRARSV